MSDKKIAIKMLNSYKNLILDYDNNIEKWKWYGCVNFCMFCNKYYYGNCECCPLSIISIFGRCTINGCCDKSYLALRRGIVKRDKQQVLKVAAERYTLLEMALIDKQVITVDWRSE